MGLLIEHCVDEGLISTREADQSIRILCQNIADWYYFGTTKEEWGYQEDFPNLAPPFKRFWCEWALPSIVNSEGTIIKNPSAGSRLGWMVNAHMSPETSAWRLESDLYLWSGRKRDPCMKACTNRMVVAPDGQILWSPENDGLALSTIYYPPVSFSLSPEERNLGKVLWHVVGLTISFCHCRNVSMEHQPARKLPGKQVPGRWKCSYRVLKIEPIKRAFREEGAPESDLKRSLHICRGHFKDYRESGLFGKYKGVFWWADSVRGAAEVGLVIKDYSVKVPSAVNS